MADTDITTISISAKADTKDASAQLKALATQLERIKKVADSGIASANLGESLQDLSNAIAGIQGLSNVKISGNLAKSLDSVIGTIGDGLANLNARVKEFDTAKLWEIKNSIQGLADIDGLKFMSGSGGGMFPNTNVESTTVSGEDFRDAAEGEDEMSNSTDVLIEYLEALNEGIAQCSSHLETMAKKTTEAKKHIDKVGSSAKSTTSKLGQLWAAMKRIAMYRAMRSAIKMVTQAFREGIQNLYQYSSLINGTFKQSMDTLATSALYLKNSLGAMVAPIINALAPAIDILVDKFVDLLNIFNQFLAMITGASTWTKALKYPKEYADNLDRAGGAAKELRATLLGFDEINRLDDLKARGGGGGAAGMDYSQMFEEVPLVKKSLSDMWEEFLESGKSKFTLWAAGLAGILSLKLAGGLTGVFGGAAGATSILGGFTATLLAAFAGFRLGNWLYYNVPGIRNMADDLMDAGLGDAIMTLTEDVKNGWGLMIDGMIEWGNKLWGFFDDVDEGWGILVDDAIAWGDKLWDAWDTAKTWWNNIWDTDTYTVLEPDLGDFADGIVDAMAEAGLIFDKGKGTYTVDINSQGKVNINNAGGGHYYSPNFDSEVKIEPEPEKTTVQVTIPQQSYVPAYLTKRAKGGSVETGDLFLANEEGPELIAHVGNKTQVANNDQITESIRIATEQGNAESNMLLREAVSLLGGILAKDNTTVTEITASSITDGLRRQNLRNGRTTVAVG